MFPSEVLLVDHFTYAYGMLYVLVLIEMSSNKKKLTK